MHTHTTTNATHAFDSSANAKELVTVLEVPRVQSLGVQLLWFVRLSLGIGGDVGKRTACRWCHPLGLKPMC